jgi:hypothetical protein
MSLTVRLGAGQDMVFSSNITHNLVSMASAAGIYEACWHPERIGGRTASDLVEPLQRGLAWLLKHEAEARRHEHPSGWGKYDNFVPWVRRYLVACEANPDADVSVSR